MNHFTYEEISTGQTEEFSTVITDVMLDSFRVITGDDNPLHRDDEYAKERDYKGRVAYGMLTA